MEDYEKLLAEGYGLRLLQSQRSRRGLVVKTSDGWKELRKTEGDQAAVCFEDQVRRHLAQGGFTALEQFCLTLDGQPYVLGMEAGYVLLPYRKREEVSFDCPQTALLGATVLAQFHRAAAGMTGESPSPVKNLIETCRDKRQELKKKKKWIYRQSRLSMVDVEVLRRFETLQGRLKETETLLCSGSYPQLMAESKEQGLLCHNRIKSSVVEMEEGALYITSFARCNYGCPLSDVAEYLRLLQREESFTPKLGQEVLEAYGQICPLDEAQRQIIGAMLLFPAKVLKLMSGYYNKRRTIKSEAFLQKLSDCGAQCEGEARLVEEMQLQ